MSEYRTNYNSNNLTFNEYLGKVFGKMAIGLAITAVVSFITSLLFFTFAWALGGIYYVFILACAIAEIVVAIRLSSKLMYLSKKQCTNLFILYSVLTGVSLSGIIMMYAQSTVWLAFGVTAIMFVCMSIIGTRTQTDLSRISGYMAPALIGLIVATLLNALIFRSDMLSWGLTYFGVILFLVIVAFDVQKLRSFYTASFSDDELKDKLMIMGAFELYLDFINIFIRVLEIFGRRRD